MNGRYEQAIAGSTWDPHSLLGSYFRTAKGGEAGCIVAEPVPGTYLCETAGGGPQRLVAIADMADWEFFDEIADAGGA